MEIVPGAVVGVLGPNGAGKSTLLAALAGDLSPASGDVRLDGKPLRSWRPIELAKRRAVLLQDSFLNFPFAVIDVVLMGRMPHCGGVERPVDYEIARHAMRMVEADHLAERIYTSLSGGERQRVQMARALAQVLGDAGGPEDDAVRYLLLDEPVNSLDIAHQHIALAVARSLARQGMGIFAILHDLNLAAQYADYLVVLQRGKVVASGPPSAVLNELLLQRVFDMRAQVLPHPAFDCPLVAPVSPLSQPAPME
ncbi:MAG: hemin import ATP-binding protein HmuV [Candidatus Roseilinea sp.]|nr:MAG: hemin import ATP-binding protein HmuV [Candidatus Roseilinea sp.]